MKNLHFQEFANFIKSPNAPQQTVEGMKYIFKNIKCISVLKKNFRSSIFLDLIRDSGLNGGAELVHIYILEVQNVGNKKV